MPLFPCRFSSHHVVEALQMFRQYATNTAVKLIVCGLNDSPHSLADNDDVHMMNISGLDSSVPELIAALVRDDMQALIPEREGEMAAERAVEMPAESRPDMVAGVSNELSVEQSAYTHSETSEAMTDQDPGEMGVELSGAASNEVNLNEQVKRTESAMD
ncbi:hypothetical protein DPMN_100671 [Dreissena polymorpha]|uniref:RNA-binding protein RO60 vWA domain-containing protein n=1 Tax=Dreissena polymorpha TaxID=45954 RepID=A0A9D4LG64_DREPO|nr:hypothetical protein DPMN_100671 [Dreissena polymorpha]